MACRCHPSSAIWPTVWGSYCRSSCSCRSSSSGKHRSPAPLFDKISDSLQLAFRVRRIPGLEVADPRFVRFVGEGLKRVGHPHEIEAALKRVTRCVARTAVGMQTGDVELRDPALFQHLLELRIQERRVGLFAPHDI